MTSPFWLARPVAALLLWSAGASLEPPPEWAYPVPSAPELARDEPVVRRVPDSAVTLSADQIHDIFFAPDWHPGDHPPMPPVVAHGREPKAYACGFCHRAGGAGAPGSANLTGLTERYILTQMANFRSGCRPGSEPRRVPMRLMTEAAKAVRTEEARAAARYFAGLPHVSLVDVKEGEVVPRTVVRDWALVRDPDGGDESLGLRIVEVPEDTDRFVNRDSRVRFTAFVPPESIARGRMLAETGGEGRTVPCARCHGPKLDGKGAAPLIIGRFPSFVVRQLLDFQRGTRACSSGAQMKAVVAKLTLEEVISLAAYTASLRLQGPDVGRR